jgi:hypothetical protein
MKEQLLRLMAGSADQHSDTEFNDLALQLFRYQYDHNVCYRQFCLSQKINAGSVESWEGIPFLPVTAFKWTDVCCRPKVDALRIFHSSGTSRAEKSRHYLFDDEIAQAAILPHFKRHVLPDFERMRMMILTPSPAEAPQASLAYMMAVLNKHYGTEKSRYYIRDSVLQSEALLNDLDSVHEPLALLGTSLSFAYFFDDCLKKGVRLDLPPRSRLMDTGGFKGVSRELPQDRLYELADELLGIKPAYCINEYGMSEMSSQFYDRIAGRSEVRGYAAPPQVRTRVLSPETLEPVSEMETGILVHLDLANMYSVCFLLTEDLGWRTGRSFVLSGRASAADQKGCSLTLDDLLSPERMPD